MASRKRVEAQWEDDGASFIGTCQDSHRADYRAVESVVCSLVLARRTATLITCSTVRPHKPAESAKPPAKDRTVADRARRAVGTGSTRLWARPQPEQPRRSSGLWHCWHESLMTGTANELITTGRRPYVERLQECASTTGVVRCRASSGPPQTFGQTKERARIIGMPVNMI